MGFLNWFSRAKAPAEKPPSGSFTVDRCGRVMTSTVGSRYPRRLLDDTAREVLSLFSAARAAQMPLAGLNLHFDRLRVEAREMQGGAIIFLSPALPRAEPPPAEKETA